MTALHIHKGALTDDWPVTICSDMSAAHAIAIYLGAEERSGRSLPPPLKDLRIMLDAKLVGDPASTTALAHMGDTSKEHKPWDRSPATDPHSPPNTTAAPRPKKLLKAPARARKTAKPAQPK